MKGLARLNLGQRQQILDRLSGGFDHEAGNLVSSLARLSHRERWLQYVGCLLDGLTIRAAAKECGISIPTSFRWRHRFVATIDTMKPPALKGIVKMDETLFRNSEKGDRQLGRAPRRRGTKAQKPGLTSEQVVVVVARARHGTTTNYILHKFNAETVAGALKTVISPDEVLRYAIA